MSQKYRRRPIIVEAWKRPDGTYLVRWSGADLILSEEQLRRDYERVPDDATVGCSCNYDQLKQVIGERGAVHASTCALSKSG